MAFDTSFDAQMTGQNGYEVDPLITVGEGDINGYEFPGIPDGIGAFALDEDTVRLLVNHEFNDNDGYLYPLNPGSGNELLLSGTRISFVDINKADLTVEDVGLAYDRVFDINGQLVTNAAQIPNSDGSEILDGEGNVGFVGFGRFCSGQFFAAGTFGLVDDMYVTGEEIDDGLGLVLDTTSNDLYLTPYLGRGGWENATFVETGTDNFTGFLWTDDSEGSLIYLWVGEKGVDFNEDGNLDILERNGLSGAGYLYAWAPEGGDLDGQSFTTTGPGGVELTGAVDIRDRVADDSYGVGSWVQLTVQDEALAGTEGYDTEGFALENTLRQEAYDKGALAWSRPEDIDTNPNNPFEFAIANTGRDTFAPIDGADITGPGPDGELGTDDDAPDGVPDPVSFDYVGDIMIGTMDFSALEGLTSYTEIADGSITTEFTLAYDGDQDPDRTLRSPDNLDWATDGFIYVNEDRAADGLWAGDGLDRITGTEPINTSESQIVRINPLSGDPADGGALPVAEMNRLATLPPGQIDTDPEDAGDWESSGVLDVSALFDRAPGELLVFDVQAHSVRGGAIGDPEVDASDPTSDDLNLVEGGQLAFLVAPNNSDAEAPVQLQPLDDTLWATSALFTVGETLPTTTEDGYTPPGILDGLGAYELDADTVRVLANHELLNNQGYAYDVSDGQGGTFSMTGARVSYFDINKETFAIEESGLAYNVIYDANGDVATDISFLQEGFAGFSRFCSSVLIEAGQFDGRGLADTIYFTGEEDGGFFNSVGGAEWALDVATGEMWQVPALGRGAWENVTEVDTGTDTHVAFILADDSSPFDFDGDGVDEAVPTYLYVGEKTAEGDFLARNGLRDGQLYVWVSDTGETTPTEFNTAGTLAGTWVAVDNTPQLDQASENGSTGFDEYGYPTQGNLVSQAEALGAFGFSRPEDVAVNPEDGTEIVLASTGVDTYDNGADTFGTLYTFDNDFTDLENPTASLTILYDGDADPDRALRSPDNLDWADDGLIYVQEDEAEEATLDGEPLFGEGAVNPNEAGIVQIDPATGAITRIANIDRTAVFDPSIRNPLEAVDQDAGDAGEWESSGILDVSDLFGEKAGSLFILDVQAHGLSDQEEINPASRLNDDDLVEGGQLIVLSQVETASAVAELVDLTGLDGEVIVSVTVSREAAFDNILRFYATDALGTVDDLLPGDAGYEAAVAANLLDAELFVGDDQTADVTLTLPGGTYYAPALLIDGSVASLATIDDAVLGNVRVQREDNVWRFEDLTDNDFNDLVLTINSVEVAA
jgi:secreted PhoX family phosphatase